MSILVLLEVDACTSSHTHQFKRLSLTLARVFFQSFVVHYDPCRLYSIEINTRYPDSVHAVYYAVDACILKNFAIDLF